MRNTKLIIIFASIAFVAAIIILSSVVFSVKYVDIYCYNADDTEFNQRVLEAANIKKGKSIFFISEKDIIKNIELGVTDAKPINVERKPFNRVQINVVKRIPHSYYKSGEDYYILDPEGKIINITDAAGLDAYEHTGTDSSRYELIELRLPTQAFGSAGGYLSTESGGENALIAYTGLLKAFYKIDYREFDAIALIDYIDLVRVSSELIIIETKSNNTADGTIIKLWGTGSLDYKIRKAMSVYLSNDIYRTNHIISVTNAKHSVDTRSGTNEDYN